MAKQDTDQAMGNNAQELAGELINNTVRELNGRNAESFHQEAAAVEEDVRKLRKLVDGNDDRTLSDREILAVLSDKNRVDEIMTGLAPEERARFADAISGVRTALEGACASLPHAVIDNHLQQAESKMNMGLSEGRTLAEEGKAGDSANRYLQNQGIPSSLTSQGEKNMNVLAKAVFSELPLKVEMPSADAACKAVEGTENPTLGYLSPDSIFNGKAPAPEGPALK